MKFKFLKFNFQCRQGFTLTELLIVIGILIVLIGIAVPAFHFFQRESDLNNGAEEIINTLRFARNKTLASEKDSQWGIYFSTSTDPHQFILFKGESFASREASFDDIHQVPKSVEIYQINLSGGEPELVFFRITGETGQFGSVSIRLKSDFLKTKTVYIENSGQAGLVAAGVISDENRIKDSRHVHLDSYSRYISTSSEKIILTFFYNSATTTEEIIISDNIKNGQIYWEKEIVVDQSPQKIKIHTHRFNDPDSLFSIHRDRRYNDKALEIEISGDGSGSLIEYDLDGQTVKGSSIYVSEPIWQ